MSGLLMRSLASHSSLRKLILEYQYIIPKTSQETYYHNGAHFLFLISTYAKLFATEERLGIDQLFSEYINLFAFNDDNTIATDSEIILKVAKAMDISIVVLNEERLSKYINPLTNNDRKNAFRYYPAELITDNFCINPDNYELYKDFNTDSKKQLVLIRLFPDYYNNTQYAFLCNFNYQSSYIGEFDFALPSLAIVKALNKTCITIIHRYVLFEFAFSEYYTDRAQSIIRKLSESGTTAEGSSNEKYRKAKDIIWFKNNCIDCFLANYRTITSMIDILDEYVSSPYPDPDLKHDADIIISIIKPHL